LLRPYRQSMVKQVLWQRLGDRLVPLHSDYDSLVWGSRTEAGSG
jgi:hypothetical protein